jgi:hypothetical protein
MLGQKWTPCIIPLKIFCIIRIFDAFNRAITVYNIAIGNVKEHTLRKILSTGILILLCIYNAKAGIISIAMGYLVAEIICFCLFFHLVIKNITICWWKFIKNLAPFLFGNLLMFSVVQYIAFNFCFERNLNNLLMLIFTGATSYIIYSISVNLVRGRKVLYPLIA